MGGRIGGVRQNLARAAVRLVVHALAALVLHDVALRVQLGQIERIEQESHAIRLDPQRRFQVVGGHRFEVRRAIVRGGAVVAAAYTFREFVVHAVGHMARAGEHDVLEQVREARAARHLVLGSDVIPHVDRHGRRGAIGREDHGQAVGKLVGFVGNPDRIRPGTRTTCRWPLRGRKTGQRQNAEPNDMSTASEHGWSSPLEKPSGGIIRSGGMWRPPFPCLPLRAIALRRSRRASGTFSRRR